MMAAMYGQVLRKLREAKGRAQAEVARKAEISPAQLARLEMNQRGLYVEDFVRIAEVLGEKPGNLLPNDLGYIGHLKPLIDRLASLEPEFLGRVEAVLDQIVLLTEDVMTTTRLQIVSGTHPDGDERRKMSARAIARLDTILTRSGSRHFSGVVCVEKGITIRSQGGAIPKWAAESGACGVLRAAGTSMRDVGIFDGDMLFVRPDANPPSGKLVICTIEDRVFVNVVKRDRGGHPTQLGSKSIRLGDHVKFYFVTVGVSSQR